ncbi:hypothetical protein GPALN_005251 [Globodera pallida]|nr:hypothetical protein GPALN_005251 [Globodera pallida]
MRGLVDSICTITNQSPFLPFSVEFGHGPEGPYGFHGHVARVLLGRHGRKEQPKRIYRSTSNQLTTLLTVSNHLIGNVSRHRPDELAESLHIFTKLSALSRRKLRNGHKDIEKVRRLICWRRKTDKKGENAMNE